MVSQIDGGENKAGNKGKEDIKDNPLMAVGQEQDHQGDLGVPAGHAITFIMFNGV